MNKLRIWLSKSALWMGILIATAVIGILGLYRVNQNAIERNRAVLIQQAEILTQQAKITKRLQSTNARSQKALGYLCNTTHTLDILVIQFVSSGLKILSLMPPSPAKVEQEKQVRALFAAHLVLSDTRACQEVTG